MKPVRIQRKGTKGWRMPQNTVCATRPGPYGNPFTIQHYFDAGYAGSTSVAATHCVQAFRAWLVGEDHWAHPVPIESLGKTPDLSGLRGKNLACWCALGQPCHADVLLEIANA